MDKSYLLFQLEQYYFAVPIQDVLHVLRNTHFIKLPQSPEDLVGIVEYDEINIPVMDLRKSISPAQKDSLTTIPWLILIKSKSYPSLPFGIMVDKTLGLFTFEKEKIDYSKKQYPSCLRSQIVSGIIRAEQKTILLLELESLMKNSHGIAS